MPKIISYTPPWLSRPSPGYHLFRKSSSSPKQRESGSRDRNGAKSANRSANHRCTIARRGTEIFVVVDNEIRWSDLCMLKDVWEEAQEGRKNERQLDEKRETNGEGSARADEKVAQSSYRVGPHLRKTSSGFSYNLGSGPQNLNRRRHSTTFDIPKRQFFGHLDLTYRAYRYTAQVVISEQRTRTYQTQGIHSWPHNPCSIPIAHHSCIMASLRRPWELPGYNYRRFGCSRVGAQLRKSFDLRQPFSRHRFEETGAGDLTGG